MPEGPEVRCVAVSLTTCLAGRTLVAITSTDANSKKYGPDMCPGWTDFCSLLPAVCVGVTCKGKRLVFVFHHATHGFFYLTNHLKMTGRWTWQEKKHTKVSLQLAPVVENASSTLTSTSTSSTPTATPTSRPHQDDTYVYFDDSRGIGDIKFFFSTDDVGTWLDKKVGPDLLANALDMYTHTTDVATTDIITAERWRQGMRVPQRQRMPVGEYLMEQKYFSGIGNYLRAEILYRAKISPFRLLSQLSPTDIDELLTHSLATIYESFCHGGLTIHDYIDPDGHTGVFPYQVYGKAHDPHGNAVVTAMDRHKRMNHWVPSVQT